MLRDNWWIIVACMAAAVAAAALYEANKTTAYSAQSKVLLLQDDPNATLGGNGFFLDPVRQRATALELITGPNVATRVQRQLKLKERPGGVGASASGDSNVVTITAVNSDRLTAARVADGYAKQYVEFRRDAVRARYDQALADVRDRLNRLKQLGVSNSEPQVRQLQQQASQLELLASTRLPDATVIQRANGFASELQKRWVRNLTLAALAGLFVGLLIAFLRDRLDDRLRSEEDLAAVLPGVPVVATIPEWRPGQRWRHAAAESFYNLGVSMRSLNGSGSSSWLVTSALGEDGKTTTALNAALALGLEGRNAILVDGDLRHPRVTEMVGAARGDGFVKVLAGESQLSAAAKPQRFQTEQKRSFRRGRRPLVTVQGDVAVLPAGRTSTAPQRLINEQSAQVLLEQARHEGRDTVIDGPPLGLFGDMLPLARRVDGVLIVVRLYHTTKRAVRVLLRQLETAGVQPKGVVVIGTDEQTDKLYGA
jgi:succinoglycan biosynthesis transport protein ExoP